MNKASWCLWLLILLTSPTGVQAETFRFVALGDLPYGSDETAGVKYRQLITQINALNPEFSIHVGDFKAGSAHCSDEEFKRQRKHFDLFKGAVIYTPGDNDWTDCGRKSNGSYDPLERLDKLRAQFFKPDKSLGQAPLAVATQAKTMPQYSTYIENQRWQFASTLFTTVHIVGSDNRFAPNNADAEKEFLARDQANILLDQRSLSSRRQSKPTDARFCFSGGCDSRDVADSGALAEKTGFHTSIEQTLLPLAKDFKGSVLIVHGDSHTFEFDQTFLLNSQVLKNVYRLEVPGAKTTGAVSVTVDEGHATPFAVTTIIVP